jgi:hypothetical protein
VNLVILSQLFVCDHVSEGLLLYCVWRENVTPCEAAVCHFQVLPTTSCYIIIIIIIVLQCQ